MRSAVLELVKLGLEVDCGGIKVLRQTTDETSHGDWLRFYFGAILRGFSRPRSNGIISQTGSR